MRAGGFGLGGVLTPTGLGTDIAEGKEIVTVDGKEYLLEKPQGKLCFYPRGVLEMRWVTWYTKVRPETFSP